MIQNWNIGRTIRLLLGVAILIQGIVNSDIVSILLGTVVSGTAVANIGCCGTTGCAINTTRRSTASPNTKQENLSE